MNTVAIIVAAGLGERMPGDTLKQLTPLAAVPMVLWSVRALAALCDAVVVVAPPGVEAALAGAEKVHAVVVGGATRQESVWNGLQALPPGAERVLIHDAARPCVSRALIARVIAALDRCAAVVPVVPVVDTLVREREGRVEAIIDRAHVALVQTPQGFAVDVIRRAHQSARKSGLKMSDDGSLVLAMHEPVVAVPGERTNIKVTYPEDVAVAAAILAGGGE